MNLLHRRLGVERDDRVLELAGPEGARDVRGDEDQGVAGGDLASPDIGGRVVVGKSVLAVRVREGQEVRLADEVGLDGAGGDDVELIAADDGDADPDRPAGRLREPELLARRGQAPVGVPDRLLEADDQAGRLVVVVLGLDGLGDEGGCLAQLPAAPDSGNDEKQAPLGARRRADRRFDDRDDVRGILQAIVLGDDAEFHLESDGHGSSDLTRGDRLA